MGDKNLLNIGYFTLLVNKENIWQNVPLSASSGLSKRKKLSAMFIGKYISEISATPLRIKREWFVLYKINKN
jgi:hypothetical protein